MIIGNSSRLFRLPLRHPGGGLISGARHQYGSNAANNNIAVGYSPMQYAGYPVGYTHPRGYNLPISTNFISSFDYIAGVSTASAAGTMGVNGASSITGTGDLLAIGQLVVSAIAAISGVGLLSGSVVALLSGVATISGSGALTGSTDGLGFMLSPIIGTGSLSLTPYALGALECDITPFTELSPENLASSVWNTEMDGLTTGTILKVLAAVAVGKTGIDTSGPDPIITFRNLLDTLDRVTATMSGSERITITIDES